MGAPEAFTATTDVGHCIAGRAVRGTGGRAPAGLQPQPPAQVARQVAAGHAPTT